MAHPITADDMAVTLAVRDDLGPQYDDAVIAEFLERVGAQIDARVSQQVQERLAQLPKDKGDPEALPICSLVFGIPITAIAMGTTDGLSSLVALAIAWTGIGIVNVAHARRR